MWQDSWRPACPVRHAVRSGARLSYSILRVRACLDVGGEAVMRPHLLEDIRTPRTDDRPLWDLIAGARGYTAMLIAHDLKLFALLGERPRSLAEICTALSLADRPAEALLTMLESLSLVQAQNARYALTPLAMDALV